MSLEDRQISHYRLLQQIGSGGMGTIYLAQDNRTTVTRQLALKIITLETEMRPDDALRRERLFRREIEMIAQLDHPHILPLFDFGEVKDGAKEYLYLVMPFRPKGSLADWLLRHPELPLQTIDTIIFQAASVLHYVHKQGIVHRDVKPSNFLVRERISTADLSEPYPFLLLTDFGLACFSIGHTSSNQHSAGTPHFMAPEQWHGNPVPASDQYALAIMAFRLLTGQRPFDGLLEQLMYQHHFVSPPVPSSVRPGLPPEIDAVIARALAKQPELRFPSILSFAEALRDAMQLPADRNGTIQFDATLISKSSAYLPPPGTESLADSALLPARMPGRDASAQASSSATLSIAPTSSASDQSQPALSSHTFAENLSPGSSSMPAASAPHNEPVSDSRTLIRPASAEALEIFPAPLHERSHLLPSSPPVEDSANSLTLISPASSRHTQKTTSSAEAPLISAYTSGKPAPVAAPPAPSQHMPALPPRTGRRKRPLRLLFAGLLLLLALLLGSVFLFSHVTFKGNDRQSLGVASPSHEPSNASTTTPAASAIATSNSTTATSGVQPASSPTSSPPANATTAPQATATATPGTTQPPQYSFEGGQVQKWVGASNDGTLNSLSSSSAVGGAPGAGSYALKVTFRYSGSDSHDWPYIAVDTGSKGPASGSTYAAYVYVPAGSTSTTISVLLFVEDPTFHTWHKGATLQISLDQQGYWLRISYVAAGYSGRADKVGLQFAEASDASSATIYVDAVSWT